jgi:hypothetical protein
MTGHSYTDKPIQIIDGQYLDQQKLLNLLRNVYGISDEGKNNFRVEVRKKISGQSILDSVAKNHNQLRLNRYKIYPSEKVCGASELTQVH